MPDIPDLKPQTRFQQGTPVTVASPASAGLAGEGIAAFGRGLERGSLAVGRALQAKNRALRSSDKVSAAAQAKRDGELALAFAIDKSEKEDSTDIPALFDAELKKRKSNYFGNTGKFADGISFKQSQASYDSVGAGYFSQAMAASRDGRKDFEEDKLSDTFDTFFTETRGDPFRAEINKQELFKPGGIIDQQAAAFKLSAPKKRALESEVQKSMAASEAEGWVDGGNYDKAREVLLASNKFSPKELEAKLDDIESEEKGETKFQWALLNNERTQLKAAVDKKQLDTMQALIPDINPETMSLRVNRATMGKKIRSLVKKGDLSPQMGTAATALMNGSFAIGNEENLDHLLDNMTDTKNINAVVNRASNMLSKDGKINSQSFSKVLSYASYMKSLENNPSRKRIVKAFEFQLKSRIGALDKYENYLDSSDGIRFSMARTDWAIWIAQNPNATNNQMQATVNRIATERSMLHKGGEFYTLKNMPLIPNAAMTNTEDLEGAFLRKYKQPYEEKKLAGTLTTADKVTYRKAQDAYGKRKHLLEEREKHKSYLERVRNK